MVDESMNRTPNFVEKPHLPNWKLKLENDCRLDSCRLWVCEIESINWTPVCGKMTSGNQRNAMCVFFRFSCIWDFVWINNWSKPGASLPNHVQLYEFWITCTHFDISVPPLGNQHSQTNISIFYELWFDTQFVFLCGVFLAGSFCSSKSYLKQQILK